MQADGASGLGLKRASSVIVCRDDGILTPPRSMQHLFTPEGDAALAGVLGRRPLLAFDFDGTLTPIVARPGDARLARGIAGQLARLGKLLPIAIVTGRQIADVRSRLGFEPAYVVGNHGAEDVADPAGAEAHARTLEPARIRLRDNRALLDAAGILVEDKRQSIALHYRLAHDRDAARRLIDGLFPGEEHAWRVFAGKQVVNLAAADAPDKAAAIRALVARCQADTVLFAGDDVNDEPVFATAPPHWLTLRIGNGTAPSRAVFYLDHPRAIAPLLERILRLLPHPAK
jgi:trehalose 6-phosphate phosphatase